MLTVCQFISLSLLTVCQFFSLSMLIVCQFIFLLYLTVCQFISLSMLTVCQFIFLSLLTVCVSLFFCQCWQYISLFLCQCWQCVSLFFFYHHASYFPCKVTSDSDQFIRTSSDELLVSLTTGSESYCRGRQASPRHDASEGQRFWIGSWGYMEGIVNLVWGKYCATQNSKCDQI